MIDLAIIAAAGVLTWGLRASFIVFAGDRPLPPTAEGVLRYARPAVLAALVASVTIGSGGLALSTTVLTRVAAAGAAGVTAWQWRNLALTLAAGFAALWSAQLAIHLLQ
jgi:branched-subunit amino acid transport protein